MPFIQLRRTDGRSDDVFTLVFDEEREEIIMRENFCKARKKKDTKGKEETRKKVLFFFQSHVIRLTLIVDSF